MNAGLNSLAANRGADLEIDSSLDPNAPLTDSRLKAMANQSALDLQAVMNRAKNSQSAAPERREPPPSSFPLGSGADAAFAGAAPVDKAAQEADRALEASAKEQWAAAAPVAAPAPEPVPAPSHEDQLVELAKKMAGLLRESATREHPRMPDGAALAPIEALHPGSIASLETTGSVLSQRLSDQDRRTLIEARDRLVSKPGEADKLSASLASISSPSALKIGRAVLCTKVMGFGKYNAYGSDTFVAGRPIPAIVYVEVENFGARSAREGDPMMAGEFAEGQQSVELAQSLTLYQDHSGLQAWHRPSQTVIETGRNKRRDFYLIQQIELPRTLSIGRYNLKVTVKDKTTGQEAEAVVPISVVAQR